MTVQSAPGGRPRNRRQLVVEAAGPIFSRRGYHGASMEEIAGAVGMTAGALYRHFPNKYALFLECAHEMVDGLAEVVDDAGATRPLPDLLDAITAVTLAHRTSGGVYRWEARYLRAEDRKELGTKFAHVVAVVAAAVAPLLRASGAAPDDAALRASAALGVIGSVTVHRTSIATRRAQTLLTDAALRVATGDLDAAPAAHPGTHPGADGAGAPARSSPAPPARPGPAEAGSRRAEILAASVPLFERDGFSAVTMSQIAREVGLAPSAIYRHYPAKVDILAEACLDAASSLLHAADRAVQATRRPEEALAALARTYVDFSFEQTALMSVAEGEVVGLPDALRRRVTEVQRDHVATWEGYLRRVSPELDQRQARVLVHAGLGVVVEAGRYLHWEGSPAQRHAVAQLVLHALGV